MAVKYPWWKRASCYLFCEWFTKPVFGKRLCVMAYDVFGIKKKVKRKLNTKDGGFRFLRVPKIIAFIGLDGSGKSTQANNTVNFLNKHGFKTSYLHMPKAVPLNIATKVSPKKIPKGSLSSSLRQLAFLAGIKWIYLFKIIPSFLGGKIIIADRWFYDELVY